MEQRRHEMMNDPMRWTRRLAVVALLLTFVMIVLGSYVRLSKAGLSCPSWPLCYGHVTPPGVPQASDIAHATTAVGDTAAREWKEMIHRYVAGTLGMTIFALLLVSIRNRKQMGQPVKLTAFISLWVIVQALLGMVTVTLLLDPLIVTGHLIGGMVMLGTLLWLVFRSSRLMRLGPTELGRVALMGGLRLWAGLALLVVCTQIFLGAWTSTNYAAWACYGFPTCNGHWWPEGMDFDKAFVFWHRLGIDYQGGVLGGGARVAIQVVHRIGAMVTTLVVGGLGLYLVLTTKVGKLRILGVCLLASLALQLALGISMVSFGLPFYIEWAHTPGAALLLSAVISVNFLLWSTGYAYVHGRVGSVVYGQV
ncbi:COX15/CtaA family protein [Acidihalobacter yilgarnensis]|nr:COX15/CtaA family protein [Acidihalobacter yilgarnensis]